MSLTADLAWLFIRTFKSIFREDKETVEMEQAAHDAQGRDLNNEVFPTIMDLRAVPARCGIAGDGTGAAAVTNQGGVATPVRSKSLGAHVRIAG